MSIYWLSSVWVMFRETLVFLDSKVKLDPRESL